jgi:hypothetical protein
MPGISPRMKNSKSGEDFFVGEHCLEHDVAIAMELRDLLRSKQVLISLAAKTFRHSKPHLCGAPLALDGFGSLYALLP